MITIIKECKKKTKERKRADRQYIKKCWNCKSKFLYQDEDVEVILSMCPDMLQSVTCPICYHKNDIYIKNRYWKINRKV